MFVKIKHEDKEYRIGFTRFTAKAMDAAGFDISEWASHMATSVPMIVHYAFKAKHPNISDHQAETIWAAQRGKNKLLHAMVESYAQTFGSLLDDNTDEDDKENVSWEIEE